VNKCSVDEELLSHGRNLTATFSTLKVQAAYR
jgi:hypothetical protein